MEHLPAVVDAEYRGDYKIHLVFSDGVEGTVDFADWLDGRVFEPLRDVTQFKRFFVEAGTIGWPNGADIAPESLYQRAKSNAAA